MCVWRLIFFFGGFALLCCSFIGFPSYSTDFFSSLFALHSDFLVSSSTNGSSNLVPLYPDVSLARMLFSAYSAIVTSSPYGSFSSALWFIVSITEFFTTVMDINEGSTDNLLSYAPGHSFVYFIMGPPGGT